MTPKTARKFAYSDPLKTQLDRAKSTRADLEAEKAATQLKLAELSRQILRTNGYIKSIKVLIEGTGALKPPETSLADFCRRGLNHFGDWVTAIEVRDYLVDLGRPSPLQKQHVGNPHDPFKGRRMQAKWQRTRL